MSPPCMAECVGVDEAGSGEAVAATVAGGNDGDGADNEDAEGDAEIRPAVAAAAKAGDERIDVEAAAALAERDVGLANTWFDPFCETFDLAVFGSVDCDVAEIKGDADAAEDEEADDKATDELVSSIRSAARSLAAVAASCCSECDGDANASAAGALSIGALADAAGGNGSAAAHSASSTPKICAGSDVNGI